MVMTSSHARFFDGELGLQLLNCVVALGWRRVARQILFSTAEREQRADFDANLGFRLFRLLFV